METAMGWTLALAGLVAGFSLAMGLTATIDPATDEPLIPGGTASLVRPDARVWVAPGARLFVEGNMTVEGEGTLRTGACTGAGPSMNGVCAGGPAHEEASVSFTVPGDAQRGTITVDWAPEGPASRTLTVEYSDGFSAITASGPPPLTLEFDRWFMSGDHTVSVWTHPAQLGYVRSYVDQPFTVTGHIMYRIARPHG